MNIYVVIPGVLVIVALQAIWTTWVIEQLRISYPRRLLVLSQLQNTYTRIPLVLTLLLTLQPVTGVERLRAVGNGTTFLGREEYWLQLIWYCYNGETCN